MPGNAWPGTWNSPSLLQCSPKLGFFLPPELPGQTLCPEGPCHLAGIILKYRGTGETTADLGQEALQKLSQTHLLLLYAYKHHRCQQKNRGCHHVQQNRSEN